MLSKKVNIVTVNYNNSLYTINMLDSLVNSTACINKVIIVDNASDSHEREVLNSIENLKYKFEVKIIFLSDNVGYFHGLNAGLREIKNYTSNMATVICNNDLVFNSDFFLNFQSLSFASDIMAVAPSIITSDFVYQNPAQINKPSFFKRFFYEIYFINYTVGSLLLKTWTKLGFSAQSKFKKDEVGKNIYIGMGAIYILFPSFFVKNTSLNYPDALFLYGEEAFLSKQIEDSNGSLFYEPRLEVVHLESVATAKLPNKKKYHLMKNSHSIYKCFFK